MTNRNIVYPIALSLSENDVLTKLSIYNNQSKAEILRRLLHYLALNANLMTLDEIVDLEVVTKGRPPRKNEKE